MTFTLRTELEGFKIKGARLYTYVDITFDAHVRIAVGWPGDPKRMFIAEPKLTPDTFVVPVDILFPSSWPATTTKPVLALPNLLYNDINNFLKAVQGFPAAASGSFARMFYFSAVTITTLGYGDIVPITNTARIIVAIESIFGIVLIGLFINSLFQERDREIR